MPRLPDDVPGAELNGVVKVAASVHCAWSGCNSYVTHCIAALEQFLMCICQGSSGKAVYCILLD